MSDADFIREVEELYLRLANADTDDLVELAKLAGLDPKTDLADSVWVPYPSFGEFRQNTLAAAVLTYYLEEHGIEVDAAAADNAQVVLPKLGKLEALLVPQDSGAEPLDLSQVKVKIDLNPATLAYVLVELGEGGAWLTGVLLSSDLRQDFPEGGAVSLAMMKPMSALREAYGWWQKCQQITAQFSDKQGWSAQQRTETITFLNWLLTNSSEYERPTLLKDFLAEKASENHENFKPLASNLQEVREATPEPSSEGAVDWLDVAMDLLDELGKFI
ncbi:MULTISPECIES: hypothetical protein [unclassified Microcystis]|uniref:hypothetical protein n=1 Tax=unclassified Microcystis TaxID=2643300 RepID=UPI00258A9B76|nr:MULTISPECIES: hypothetical protein [unclassified Microcystis]MCA2761919.1 hypothetical protein [Microcystis sp. M151S2]MCA2642569.1 hypothetical protein [Microcystis sp. M087S2]MCA2671300.1 hypothetical protein [Microcystis sp. M080S2]MCA2690270.1 hypothetical protein [Microcystis sp. M037S2]MCA2735161.1 hypothetical protein [Microcystis sp. M158S2]